MVQRFNQAAKSLKIINIKASARISAALPIIIRELAEVLAAQVQAAKRLGDLTQNM
jgi:hypothetical protein